MTALGPQLLENPDCDLSLLRNGVQVTAASRFAFNGDGQFAVWYGAFPEPGTYRLVAQYSASDPVRAVYGSGHIDMPATDGEGSYSADITVAGKQSLQFNDLESAAGHLTRVELFKFTPA